MNKLGVIIGAVGAFLAAAVLGFVVVLAREAKTSAHEVETLRGELATLRTELAAGHAASRTGQGRPNVLTSFNPDVNTPRLKDGAFVDPMASIIGDVQLAAGVYVAPFASIRGDEGQPIAISEEANVQDGVVLHALETESHGKPVANRTYEVNGKKYAVYIGKRVSMAHQSQVHGPARVDDDVFVGMQALVFKSWIGRGSVVEPGAKVIGVTVPPGRYIPAGTVLTSQAQADKLPEITEDYPFKGLNEAVVEVNTSFAERYGEAARPKPAEPAASEHPGAVAAAPAEHH